MSWPGDYSFSFANPWFLLALLLIPLLAWLKGRMGKAPAVVFSSTSALQEIGRTVKSRSGQFLAALFYAGLALLIIAWARPQAGKSMTHTEASGVDIMIVVDVSASMLLEDYRIGGDRASRLDAIKSVTKKFIEQRPNDRIGMIAFAGRPYLVSPMTLDHGWLLQNLDRVRIGLVEDGTAIGSAIAAAANRLKEREAKTKLVILLTDGDNNAGQIPPLTAAEAADALHIKVYTIGAGTNNPAPWPVLDQNYQQQRDMFGRPQYMTRQFGFEETTLKKIAAMTSGHYFRAADLDTLKEVYGQIDQMEKTPEKLTKYSEYRDLFPWFLATGLGVLLLELALAQTLWRCLP